MSTPDCYSPLVSTESRDIFSIHVDTARTWRGGQRQVWLTVLGLRARGHRVALVAHPQGELYRRAAEGPDLYPLAPRHEVDLHAAWQLSRLVRQLAPDLVHAHDAHAVAVASLALSLGGGSVTARFVASRRVDFHVRRNAFSRWKYRQVDRFICASDAVRRMLVDDGVPAARATVVHEGIDLDHIAAAPLLDLHREFWLPHGAPIVGNIAALVPHKGQRYLIDAAARVVREVPDARFLIVGAGELQANLTRHIKRLELQRHVILTGFRPDVLSLLKGFDVFVMSSVTEGLGTSVLDAMACGGAVVATHAGGIPESVVDGETGLLVPVRDPDRLAAAVVRLLRDQTLRRAYGDAGRARARTRFSAARMVDETVAVYADVVGRTPAADSARLGVAD